MNDYFRRALAAVSLTALAIGVGVSSASADALAPDGDLGAIDAAASDGGVSEPAAPAPELEPAPEPVAPAPEPVAPAPELEPAPEPASPPQDAAPSVDAADQSSPQVEGDALGAGEDGSVDVGAVGGELSAQDPSVAQPPAQDAADPVGEAMPMAKLPARVRCAASPNPSDGTVAVTVTLVLLDGQGGQYSYDITVTKPDGTTVSQTGKIKSGQVATMALSPALSDGVYDVMCAVAHDQSGKREAEAPATFEVKPLSGTPIELASPTFVPPTCANLFTRWAVPASVLGLEKFILLPSGRTVTPGEEIIVSVGDEPLSLAAFALEGYRIVSESEWTLSGGTIPGDCLGSSSAVAPTLMSAPTCEVAGSIYRIAEAVEGIDGYLLDGIDVEFGHVFTVPVGESVVVEAYTLPGSGFELMEPSSWTLHGGVAATGCDTEPAAGPDPDPASNPTPGPMQGPAATVADSTPASTVTVVRGYPVTKATAVDTASPSALADTGTSAGTLLLVAPLALVVGLAAMGTTARGRRSGA